MRELSHGDRTEIAQENFDFLIKKLAILEAEKANVADQHEVFQGFIEQDSFLHDILLNKIEFGSTNCNGPRFEQSGSNVDTKIQRTITFVNDFSSIPTIFLSVLHLEASDYAEFAVLATQITRDGYALEIWGADDMDIRQCGVQWLAIHPSLLSRNSTESFA